MNVLKIVLVAVAVCGCNRAEDYSRSHSNTRATLEFARLLREYGNIHGTLPGPKIEDAARAILEDPQINSADADLSPFLSNRDAYGRPFIYTISDDKMRATVKSLGRNGRDDEGKSDDIIQTVDVFSLPSSGEAKVSGFAGKAGEAQ